MSEELEKKYNSLFSVYGEKFVAYLKKAKEIHFKESDSEKFDLFIVAVSDFIIILNNNNVPLSTSYTISRNYDALINLMNDGKDLFSLFYQIIKFLFMYSHELEYTISNRLVSVASDFQTTYISFAEVIEDKQLLHQQEYYESGRFAFELSSFINKNMFEKELKGFKNSVFNDSQYKRNLEDFRKLELKIKLNS